MAGPCNFPVTQPVSCSQSSQGEEKVGSLSFRRKLWLLLVLEVKWRALNPSSLAQEAYRCLKFVYVLTLFFSPSYHSIL